MVGAAVAAVGVVSSVVSSNKASGAASKAARQQENSQREAIEAQREAAARAQGFFEPFAGSAQRGIEASSFLANPQAQFDFLQSNPLFQMGLDNANRVTQQSAASRGRLNAGDTLEQLNRNALLTASPLIDTQRQDIGALLNLGTGIATSQANIETGQAARVSELLQGIGNSRSAGTIAKANADQGRIEGITEGITSFFGGFA